MKALNVGDVIFGVHFHYDTNPHGINQNDYRNPLVELLRGEGQTPNGCTISSFEVLKNDAPAGDYFSLRLTAGSDRIFDFGTPEYLPIENIIAGSGDSHVIRPRLGELEDSVIDEAEFLSYKTAEKVLVEFRQALQHPMLSTAARDIVSKLYSGILDILYSKYKYKPLYINIPNPVDGNAEGFSTIILMPDDTDLFQFSKAVRHEIKQRHEATVLAQNTPAEES